MKTVLSLILKNKIPVLIGVMALVIVVLFSLLRASNKEKKRFESNQHSLFEQVEYFKTESGLSAATVEKLTLTNREFKNHEADLLKKVDDLNLKVKRLQSATEVGIKTEYIVKTEIRDSLVYVEGKPIYLKCVEFDNEWLTVDGCVKEGVFDGLIQSRDTLAHFAHRVPRKFLFIKYGTKGIDLSVMTSNPYSKITYAKYIELKR
jgi:hypothetical protein